jgi:ketosteroid isomerase-like protein
LIGNRPGDRTPEGLWPSDHAGVLASLTVRGEPDNISSREALAVVTKLYDCFVQQDFEAAEALIAPDSHWSFPGDPAILPWAGNYQGINLGVFLQACATTLDYLEYTAHTFHVDGQVVTVRSNERCRVRRTGKIFRHDLTAVVRVRDGRVVQFVEYGDTAAMHDAFADDITP